MELITPSAASWSTSDGDTGVLVLHGFTGNPAAMRPLADRLADEGHRIELPRLPGHGTSWRDLAATTWDDWLGAADAAFTRLGPRPRAIVGLSMGGALALRIAELRPDEVDALVVINPFLRFEHPLKPALGLLRRIVPSLPAIGNDIARPGADEHPSPRVPLSAAASLFGALDGVRDDLHRIHAPTLVLTSRTDHTVDPADSGLALAGIVDAPTRQVWLERSFHVATIDYDADLIADLTTEWLDERLRDRPSADARPEASPPA